ncbi:MAG: OBG GTPase family GTP-binding protein [Thermoplasmata archaeon]
MGKIEDQIREIEEEIHRTPFHKATEHHIGKLKARLAKLREKLERGPGTGAARGFGIRKSGNATIGIVGLPNVGKSTLLNQLTDAESEVGDYDFTTINVIPGVMHYRGAKFQLFDMPGLIDGAARGRGRGREVLSVARSSDLILLVVDVRDLDPSLLARELEAGGIRLNQVQPDIAIEFRNRGGLTVSSTKKLTHMEESVIVGMLREWGYVNADVIVKEDITESRLIDFLAGNRAYMPAFVVLNKIDLVPEKEADRIVRKLKGWTVVPVSALKGDGLEKLREAVFSELEFIRVYMKPQGRKVDRSEPLVVKQGSTVGMVCDAIHRDFRQKFKYANVWGDSAKFPGQTVGLNHELRDEDVITIVVQR